MNPRDKAIIIFKIPDYLDAGLVTMEDLIGRKVLSARMERSSNTLFIELAPKDPILSPECILSKGG